MSGDNFRSDVYSREIDDSSAIQFSSNTYAILFGASKRGPKEPIFVTNYAKAVEIFGKPEPTISRWMYDAMSYFTQGGGAWMQRVLPSDVTYGGTIIQNKLVGGVRTQGRQNVAREIPEDINLMTAGGASNIDDNLFYIYCWGPGSYSGKIRIKINSDNIRYPVLDVPACVPVNASPASYSLLATGTYNYVVTAYTRKGETIATAPVTINISNTGRGARIRLQSKVSGASGYKIYRKLSSGSTYQLVYTMPFTSTEWIDYGRNTPQSVSPPVSDTIPNDHTFGVLVYDEEYSKTTPKETFNVSLVPRLSEAGEQLEIEEVINSRSTLIRVISNGSLLSSVPLVYAMDDFYLQAGDSGSAISDSDIINSIEKFRDAEKYPASLILDCGNTQVTVQKAIQSIVEERKWMIGILNVPSRFQDAASAVDYRANTLSISSSRCALFTNDILIKDTLNDQKVYVPPSGMVAAALAYTDKVANPGYSPAGFRRGVVSQALGLRYNYNPTEKDQLASAQVNYYSLERNYGAVLRESYTLQSEYSSLSYISVRRIIDIAEENTEKALRFFLQEPNDEFTALQLAALLRDYYQLMVSNRMIKRFEVTTQTPDAEVQLGNRMIYTVIEPLLPMVRIFHTTIISKQGADFQEVLERYTQAES